MWVPHQIFFFFLRNWFFFCLINITESSFVIHLIHLLIPSGLWENQNNKIFSVKMSILLTQILLAFSWYYVTIASMNVCALYAFISNEMCFELFNRHLNSIMQNWSHLYEVLRKKIYFIDKILEISHNSNKSVVQILIVFWFLVKIL